MMNKKPTIKSIVNQTQALYSLPLFYERLNEKINHPHSSLADIGKVISEDQGLTVRLLKLANSPFYGYYSKIDSITRALGLIGMQQLRDLALAVSIKVSFGEVPNQVLSIESFWKHNIACGILSRNIATYRREANQELFFVIGMLHDVGILVMCSTIPENVLKMLQSRADFDAPYHILEQKHFGFDHSAVGSALLTQWKIPLNISEPVAYHHSPSSALQYPMEAATLHLADIICHTMSYSQAKDKFVPAIDNAAWRMLDIPVNQLDTIIKQSESQIEETCAILSEEA